MPAGYRVRRPRRDDAESVAALERAVDIEIHGESDVTASDVLDEWSLPRFSLDDDAWLVETAAGDLAAYGSVWYENPPGEAATEQVVHPSHRGRGLTAFLLDLGETRARDHDLRIHDGRRAPVSIVVPACEADKARVALVTGRGYRQVRVFGRMVTSLDRQLDEPRWPPGIVVRHFQRGADEAAVHAATEEAFRDHFRPDAMNLDEWLSFRFERSDLDLGLWWVAWAGDEVAGSLLAFETPLGGYIDELSVRRPWRRAGVGRALLLQAFAELRRRGQPQAFLGVDTVNPTGAMRLYESVGMTLRKRPILLFEKLLT